MGTGAHKPVAIDLTGFQPFAAPIGAPFQSRESDGRLAESLEIVGILRD